MKCPECQFENVEGAKFCRKCGHKQEILCSECGNALPPDSVFCQECGHNLTLTSEPPPKALSFDEKIAKIQRYLPEGLTEKILSQRDRIEGERKQVTVMFCDMEGFTGLTERLGPEEAYSIMDQVYEILIHKVHDYEGTVNEMTGDGIVALFGAPIALEDAPQRAIRSAMAIHREMVKFSERIGKEKAGTPSLKMRVGIHSGPVVVGTLGNDLRVEFKAVGDTVNLASRMEELASPGTTYVTEETFKLSEGLFRFESLGGKEIKGKEEPVNVYQVIAPSTRRTRFDVSAERGLTPFVGRERELDLLLDGFERAQAGRGQAFSIVAEAGLGKSRLLYEFRKALVNEDVTFLEGRCLSYSRGVAYHPVIDILKAYFEINEADADSKIEEKVKNGLKILGVDEASTLPYVLELLSVKESGIDKIPLSPEARKDRIIEALRRIPLKGSEIRPLIMAIEDLHWADKSSEDALKYLLESIPGARVLLIFTYRPEFVHTWGAKSFHNQLNLNRLSNRETLAMVSSLLGREDIDSSLEQLILEKTEGVPFFIEEFLTSLKDLKLIVREDTRYHLRKDIQEVAIPATIQDVIMARVDSLPEGAKELLQAGSVIEREFSYELIKHVTAISQDELLSNLSVLKDSELVYERGVYPTSTYIFKHALTQEVLYESILTKRKKKLHEDIGNAIEYLYQETVDQQSAVLSEHFVKSENYEKGAEYSRLTARKHEKTASMKDAIAYVERTVTCLERLPQNEDLGKQLIDARTSLGLYHTQLNHHVEAKEAVDPILELAMKSDYKRRFSQINTIIGSYSCMVEEELPKALKQLEKALGLSKEVNDLASLFFADFWLGTALSYNCEFEKALSHFDKALEINVATNTLWGISMTESMKSLVVGFIPGCINDAQQASEKAVRIAEGSADVLSRAHAFSAHGFSCYGRGFLKEARGYLHRGADLCERTGDLAWHSIAQLVLAETAFEMREYQTSLDHYNRAILLLEKARVNPSLLNLNGVGCARARVMANEKNIDLKSVYRHVENSRLKWVEGWIRRYVGEILLNIDDQHMSESQDWIEKAMAADKKNGMMLHLGHDYVLYAQMFKRRGDRTRAKEILTKGIDIYRECGADGWVEKAEKELALLS